MKCLFATLFLTLSFVPATLSAQTKGNPGFDKLKTLVGTWEGKSGAGKPVRLSYKLVSADSALLETLMPEGEAEMVTVYSRDGDQVAVTHYCSANNQPRMRTNANPVNPGKLDFSFVGATNLQDPGAGHMHGLILVFEDKDHLTQKWTWREQGKPDAQEVFSFTRKQ